MCVVHKILLPKPLLMAANLALAFLSEHKK